MTQELGSRAEAELAIERLIDKLDAWLLQQPETLIIWAQPKAARKEIGRAIAHAFTTIPTREGTEEPNRALRRRILAELEKEKRDWWKDISI